MTTADQEREALEPCPFCGSPAMWCENKGNPANMDDPQAGGQWIQCSKCLCSTMMSWSLMEDCKPRLAEAWNRRTPSQPAAVKESLTVAQPAPAVPAGWRPISEAPEGKLIVAGWIDSEGQEWHDFDYLEDGTWMHWQDHYDHVTAIGGHGVKEQAPYTHFMDIAPIPAAPTPHPGHGLISIPHARTEE